MNALGRDILRGERIVFKPHKLINSAGTGNTVNYTREERIHPECTVEVRIRTGGCYRDDDSSLILLDTNRFLDGREIDVQATRELQARQRQG